MMNNYYQLLEEVYKNGVPRKTRNGRTISLYGHMLTYDLNYTTDPSTLSWLVEMPFVRARKMYWSGVWGELRALLKGDITNVEDFHKEGCHYWDLWAEDNGNIKLAYGNAWRDFNGVDQLKRTVKSLQADPGSRRHLVSAWDPANLDDLSSQCCHYAYQWYSQPETKQLDMIWVQRSIDVAIGLPSDILLGAFFNCVMAALTGHTPGRLIMQLGDCHIYEEHLLGVRELLQRATSAVQQEKTRMIVRPEVIVSLDNIKHYAIEFGGDDPTKKDEPLKFTLKK